MNNTVDALKNLYKTLTGQDYSGEPNPTDAEMIDAIAKDATGGGEESAFLSLEYDYTTGKITTTFDDIVDACEKGIPCAIVHDDKVANFLGVGNISKTGDTINGINFVNLRSLTNNNGTKYIALVGTYIIPNGTTTFTNGSVAVT